MALLYQLTQRYFSPCPAVEILINFYYELFILILPHF